MIRISIQTENFDCGHELDALGPSGALATFVGQVRGDNGLVELMLEHYPGMTEAALRALATEASTRWALEAVTIVHRVGSLRPGDRIVLVATAAPHRAAALDASAFLIDRLKTDAPFWKKERFENGSANWVDSRASDSVAASRWG
jgi:molybdopterin synthase catalytic subunit